MRIQSVALVVLLMVGIAALVMGATPLPPRTIAYQGRLTDAGGTPVTDGSYNLNFSIWNDPSSTSLSNKMWESGSVSVSVAGGLFNVNLGAPGQTALPDSIFVNDTNLYLGMSVNGGAEMTPRTRLTSVAYAYVAGTVPDSSLSSTKITDEAGMTFAMIPGGVNFQYSGTGINSDLATISITTPGPGAIVVSASGQLGISATVGLAAHVSMEIDQTAGGYSDTYYYYWFGANSWVNTGLVYQPVEVRRAYYIFSPGTYTFRLEGYALENSTSAYLWSPVITANYYPTYYGLLLKSNSAQANYIDTAYVDGEVPVRTSQPAAKQPPAGLQK